MKAFLGKFEVKVLDFFTMNGTEFCTVALAEHSSMVGVVEACEIEVAN